jgi:RecB family endonuclease NucS
MQSYTEAVAKDMKERELQENVITCARLMGYTLIYHTWSSVHSPGGFPDLVLCKPSDKRIIYIELKSEKGKLTASQVEWLEGLHACGQETYLFRPSDWLSGHIKDALASVGRA